MLPFLKRSLDRWAIRVAAKTVECGKIPANLQEQTESILNDPRFLSVDDVRPAEVKFVDQNQFTFESRRKVAAVNDVVKGKWFQTNEKSRGTVLLVHGWNAELYYQHLLPKVAVELNRGGFDAVMIELPYHAQRHPRNPTLPRNFISGDLPFMLKLIGQAVADCHAVMLWAQMRTGNPAAIWGYSLGAWLAGLLCTVSTSPYAALLATPVSRLDLAIAQLAFCEPIREALKVAPVDMPELNLNERRLQVPAERVQVLQSAYDCFVPGETVEELERAWRVRKRTNVPQSHISVLLSGKVTRKMVEWLSGVFPPR